MTGMKLSEDFIRFQSLLYWISYSYMTYKGIPDLLEPGFNPYYTGFPILIVFGDKGNGFILEFQSLLYWISYSYETWFKENYGKNNVSILIILDFLFLYVPETVIEIVEARFNPYYTGFPILIPCPVMVQLSVYHVSILIILDFLFLFYNSYFFYFVFFVCFNPYYTGFPILIFRSY